MRSFIILLGFTVLAAACGYRGPLYLPKDKPAAAKPATVAPPVGAPQVRPTPSEAAPAPQQ
jgi:predicted small lipoprotein YifL